MMAHEFPLQLHGIHHSAPSGRTKKSKHHQAKLSLPNGQKPDFGPAKERPPQLSNGKKPDFRNTDQLKKELAKLKKSKTAPKDSDHSLSTNSSSNSNSNENSRGGGGTNSANIRHSARKTVSSGAADPAFSSGKSADCYAGSSFHSSPEAVALPKPSFAAPQSSPSQNAGAASSPLQSAPVLHSPRPRPMVPVQPMQLMPLTGQYNLHPAFVYPGVPSSGAPRYPVTTYPVPAKEYSNGPMLQGYMAPAPVPPYPYPMATTAGLQQAPIGHRITFNDLMGSNK